ncbi:MAG: tetraacyldisaccharide 4'-kinase [Bernardetiaceae bacterium]
MRRLLALIFDGLTRLRNWLYDKKLRSVYQPSIPSIGVGNLTVGGTGKTPHVEFLVRHLSARGPVVVLSRGYKRATKGFRWDTPQDTPQTIGDEPFQIARKFDGQPVRVAVGEDRVAATQRIIAEAPETKWLVFDDVFQHRPIAPQLLLLLSDYNRPFYADYLLPQGRLREARHGGRRADALLITKAPGQLTTAEKTHIRAAAQPYLRPQTPIFFSTVVYGEIRPLLPERFPEITSRILLVTGIGGNTKPLRAYLSRYFECLDEISFGDHHAYTAADMQRIAARLRDCPPQTSVLTTEKDAVKWLALRPNFPAFYLPIEVDFPDQDFLLWLKEKIAKG